MGGWSLKADPIIGTDCFFIKLNEMILSVNYANVNYHLFAFGSDNKGYSKDDWIEVLILYSGNFSSSSLADGLGSSN